jgi:hypothetical protein
MVRYDDRYVSKAEPARRLKAGVPDDEDTGFIGKQRHGKAEPRHRRHQLNDLFLGMFAGVTVITANARHAPINNRPELVLERGAGVAERRVDGFHLCTRHILSPTHGWASGCGDIARNHPLAEPCGPYDCHVNPLRFGHSVGTLQPSTLRGRFAPSTKTATPIKMNHQITQ